MRRWAEGLFIEFYVEVVGEEMGIRDSPGGCGGKRETRDPRSA